MALEGHWRRQWAGAAEYGKMVDGGGGVVQTARAFEVMHASSPSARVRVMRTAFHSSGPLSSSYMLQSSTRRIFSSGADILLSPSLVSKPLELSSTPLDNASDSCHEGEEPYKVTEPDDTDISEPSKWKSAGIGSYRMPSEESSSTDNASLVDSGTKVHFTRTSQPNHSSKTSSNLNRNVESKSPTFIKELVSSPLMKISEHTKCLESSMTNSTSNQNEWHDRRRSYGFEDSPSNYIRILSDNDKFGMESSTDSGICKSTEIVNIPIDKYKPYDVGQDSDVEIRLRSEEKQETFHDWLAKNRASSRNMRDFSSMRSNQSTLENDTGIELKSLNKISVSLPINTLDSENDRDTSVNISVGVINDNSDKKFKKVEFCKTELHFAAESGKVKIIETDGKPPSSNDFRRRRNVFVPINEQIDRPVTLFGGTDTRPSERHESILSDIIDRFQTEEQNDSFSSVKSILKNKIPKPKPYILGESSESFDKDNNDDSFWGTRLRRSSEDFPTNTHKTPIVTLNESLKEENRFFSKITHELDQKFNRLKNQEVDRSYDTDMIQRENNNSPFDYVNVSELNEKNIKTRNVASTQTSDDYIYNSVDELRKQGTELLKDTQNISHNLESNASMSIREKLKKLQMSPILENRAKTRHLRQNELSYFGIPAQNEKTSQDIHKNIHHLKSTRFFTNLSTETVCPERKSPKRANKLEAPVYQNLPIKSSFAPVPAPRKTRENQENSREINKSDNSKTKKYSSDDSNDNNTDDEDNHKLKSTRKSMRALETINELKVVSEGITAKLRSSNKDSVKEAKTRKGSQSPTVIGVETQRKTGRSKSSINKFSSNESVAQLQENSLDDLARLKAVKPHRSKKPDDIEDKIGETGVTGEVTKMESVFTPFTTTVVKASKDKSDSNPTTIGKLEQKTDTSSSKRKHIESKVSNRKSPDKSKELSLQRKHLLDQTESESKSQHKHHTHSSTKKKHSKPNEGSTERSGTIRTMHSKPEELKRREKSMKKEIILNYDDKNGTLSSISRGHSKRNISKKHEKSGSTLTKIEEKPKETMRKSRLTSLEVRNPLLPSTDLHKLNKSAEHRSHRRKHREESSK